MRNRLLALAFLFAISLPPLLWAAGVRQVADTSRTVPEMPDLSDPRPFDTRWWSQIGRAYSSQAPGSATAVEVAGSLKVELFDTSTRPNVAVGADGWLFQVDTWREFCEQHDTKGLVEDLELVSALLEATGRELVVVVGPPKWAIHPEHLGPLEARVACAVEPARRFRDALSEAHLPGLVDGWSAMEDFRRRGGRDAYLPGDTHWLPIAAIGVAEQVTDRVAPGRWEELDVELDPELGQGGLARQLGLDARGPGRLVVAGSESVDVVGEEGRRPPVTVVDNGPGPHMVVLRDSFWLQVGQPVETAVGRATVVNRNARRTRPGAARADVVDVMAALTDADVLVYQSAASPMLDRLATELPLLTRSLLTELDDQMGFTPVMDSSELPTGRPLLVRAEVEGPRPRVEVSANPSTAIAARPADAGGEAVFHVIRDPGEIELVDRGGRIRSLAFVPLDLG